MTGDSVPRPASRLAEWIIMQACRGLPEAARDERLREWAGELPAIMADPDVRMAWMRSARVLLFALGVARFARRGAGRSGAARASAGARVAAQVVGFAVTRREGLAAAGMRTDRLLAAPWPVIAAFVTAHDVGRTNIMSLADVVTMAGSVMGFAAVSVASRRFWHRRRVSVR